LALKFINTIQNTDGKVTLVFEGDINELSKNINDFFLFRKYKLKSGTLSNAIYEKGSYVARILFGAFVKYYKFNIIIQEEDEKKLLVHLLKGHSGFSGGLIGIAKLKKEFKLIIEALEKADSALGIYAAP
jgi:hypothetical protein